MDTDFWSSCGLTILYRSTLWTQQTQQALSLGYTTTQQQYVQVSPHISLSFDYALDILRYPRCVLHSRRGALQGEPLCCSTTAAAAMRGRWTSLSILFAAASSARAAVVEVDALTTVTVEAQLYDTTLGAAGGCDPAGCTGDKTRVSFIIEEDLMLLLLVTLYFV